MEVLAQLYSSRHSTVACIVCALILSSLIRSYHFKDSSSSSSSLSSSPAVISSSPAAGPPLPSSSSLSQTKPRPHSTSPAREFPFSSPLLSPTCWSSLQVAGSPSPSSCHSSASVLLSSSIPHQPILSSSSSSGVPPPGLSRGGGLLCQALYGRASPRGEREVRRGDKQQKRQT